MKPTFYLLDAFALIFRAYYAFLRNPRLNSHGKNVNALYGFTTTLLDIITRRRPDYLAVAFEHPAGNFREKLFPDYKAQREAVPEDILGAIEDIKKLLETFRVPALSLEGYEADDVIGMVANQALGEGCLVYMVTPDKDFGQLVTEECLMLKPTTDGFDLWGPREVCEHFSIRSPRQMIDYLGLVGDASDNVPGCKGIGKGTASKLLMEFDTIEDIYDNLDRVKPAFRKKLEADRDATLLSKRLVTIVTESDRGLLPLKEYAFKEPDAERVADLLLNFEFNSLLKRYFPKNTPTYQPSLFVSEQTSELSEPSSKKPASLFRHSELSVESKEIVEPVDDTEIAQRESPKADKIIALSQSLTFEALPMKHTIVETLEEQQTLWNRLAASESFAFDTETTSTDSLRCSIVAASFCPAPGEVYYLPLPPDAQGVRNILAPLSPLMRDPSILKVAQNAKFDAQVLARYGVDFPTPLFDTLVAHYLLSSERRHNLDAIALETLGYRMIPYSALSEKKDFSLREDVDPSLLAIYAAEDADVTRRIQPILSLRLHQESQERLFREVEMPLVPVLAAMEEIGVRFDPEALKGVELGLEKKIEEISEDIYKSAGTPFNINSPSQVGEILFGKMGIAKNPKRTKGGSFATGEEILQKYAPEFPVVRQILEYRGLVKLLNTYVRTLPDFVHEDGRIHCHFNQAVTATGRLSSSDPNLQNIPIRSALGQEIRSAFVAGDQDHIFLSADYSQIELRLAAHISQDKALIAAINAGSDIHRETAAKLYHIAPQEVTPAQRSFAKTANFGILYGITPYGLSQRLQVPFKDANELIKNYFKAFPGIADYMENAKQTAREKGYVETLLGRRRYLPDINSQNATVRGNAERNAINTRIQGTAADLIKIAMVRIHSRMLKEGFRSRMILQIHDELNFDALRSEAEDLAILVREEMMQAIGTLSVPLEVSIGMGENWLIAH